MNFRILNYFLTVAHEKNITKAAEVLHITQPTLSRQLMQLEEDLGTKLFDRSQHKFALTPSGQFLVQRAQEILDMVEKTTLDIQDQEQNLSGSIAFGAGEYYATQTLAQLIGAFQRQYPAVTFDLFTATADTLLEKMEKGLKTSVKEGYMNLSGIENQINKIINDYDSEYMSKILLDTLIRSMYKSLIFICEKYILKYNEIKEEC